METHRHKYQHIRGRIMDMVESLEVGEALPPERSLCEMFEVSRVTLRRALDELAREGYLVRRQGSGTFVARPK
ncbi:MAG: GntR family transcriptional regulator, partial [Rubrobacter sp.]|nr:GntR family transcriptional regulator [Rubrobacter sp.]